MTGIKWKMFDLMIVAYLVETAMYSLYVDEQSLRPCKTEIV